MKTGDSGVAMADRFCVDVRTLLEVGVGESLSGSQTTTLHWRIQQNQKKMGALPSWLSPTTPSGTLGINGESRQSFSISVRRALVWQASSWLAQPGQKILRLHTLSRTEGGPAATSYSKRGTTPTVEGFGELRTCSERTITIPRRNVTTTPRNQNG